MYEEVHLFVSGRVQGVGFRYHTRQQAAALGLGGWVRNTEDGRVELVAVGPVDAVERLIAWSHHGPAASEVKQVEVRHRKPVDSLPAAFEIRR